MSGLDHARLLLDAAGRQRFPRPRTSRIVAYLAGF
jgi:hypothetical protein